MTLQFLRHRIGASTLALAAALPAAAQDRGVSYTLYGTPGLIEMPSAISANDGEIVGTISLLGTEQRNAFTFQITPRLSGTFRYSGVDDFEGPDTRRYNDRSFDIRYRLTDEGEWMPMIAVGLQDFLGTGLASSEYIVATKTLSDSLRVTGGIGWGRFGSYNGFSNPFSILSSSFDERPTIIGNQSLGGEPNWDTWFRGDAALFGGVEWAASEKLTVKVEYSSDDGYRNLQGDRLFDRDIPLNFGLTYRPGPGFQTSAALLYGSELAVAGTIFINPSNRPFMDGMDIPPPPVMVRPGGAEAARSWDLATQPPEAVTAALRTALRAEGIELNSIELTGTTARIRYTNTRYRPESQGMGRVVRVLSRELPASIETFTLEPMQRGIPLSQASFARSQIEYFENRPGGSDAMLAGMNLQDAGPSGGMAEVPPVRDAFSWGAAPYVRLSYFGGNAPVVYHIGGEVSATYRFRPELVMAGAVSQRLLTNSGEVTPAESDGIPIVRRNAAVYFQEGNPGIEYLTLAHYSRPGPNLYGRATVGYLERMYGGVSTELLWKPVDSPWAVGAEVNYVMQRDFDMLFGFQDFDTVSGHASLYYAFDNGFNAQLDVGRYLAGDWGATFGLDREFPNGWKVGAYFTLTDMSFEDFGEGSFDKGIRLTIPTDFIIGQPNRRTIETAISSLTRDGGARVEVDGRLYETVRAGHFNELSDSWGRFWR
jgi:opacity protein-like surface antigen